jgi:hypothetical protein
MAVANFGNVRAAKPGKEGALSGTTETLKLSPLAFSPFLVYVLIKIP